ncbi:hypothetical protein JQ633_10730 [Bradyrhizobium tropiciagri]|uniref:YncE family protein n=1 Tax=Bradyrhizobium tropiciagri TaxID=312253 RepID=UPI001BAA21BD|nr:hypothetical protein [Bradyrhizobium tropiciagri]MBR0870833.1 hypothetical protein [Bradyrhizobium tropiciagri]
MNSIRKIANSEYFAILVDGRDDWIMRPSLGRWPALRAGILPNGAAWFFNPDAGFAFYDTAQQQLVDRLQTPVAVKSDGKEARNDYLSYGVLESTDGRLVYLVLYHDAQTDLHVVDLETRKIVRSVLELPKGIPLCPPVLDRDGRVLVSTYRHDNGIVAGLLRIDPQTGHHELSMCDGSSARTFLIRSSPCGRYWLRADNTRLPVITEEAPLFSRLLGRGAAARKDYFSFAVEIWEAFPLRRLHSVAPMWMTPAQLPDEGHIDYERQKQGLLAQRGQVYRKVAELLDRETTLSMSQISEKSHPELWPDPNGFYTNINSNLREFEFAEREVIGWQRDSQAFWLKRLNFVACVGVDGTVSPKIMLERFGMDRGGWRPAARGWYEAKVLPDRRLDLRFAEGTVTVSGAPGDPVHEVRIVPATDDHFRPSPSQPTPQQDKDAALAKKAEAIAKRYSTYTVDLASMSEADCAAAIDTLTAQIGPDINERPFDNHLQAVFRHDGKRLNEKKFFTHVAANCPGAAPALRRLIDAVCAHVGPHTQAWYDPYADDIPTALFGYAAWCLAKLDTSSNEVLLRYYRLVDTDHENFYFAKIVPLMLHNTADASQRLQLAEGLYFGDLGNAIDHVALWRMAKMAETAASLMTPKQYAAHLMQLAAATSAARSRAEYGYYCFDNLARFLKEPSPWETELLQELRAAAEGLMPQ